MYDMSSKSFSSWLEVNGVESPKVCIRSQSSSADTTADQKLPTGKEGRGLYAVLPIFSGERILRIPPSTCLSDQHLKSQGLRILQYVRNQGDAKEHTKNLLNLSKEQGVIGMIEELRQLLSTCDHNDNPSKNPVQRIAESLGYKWRQDDAVALYLVAARKIAESEFQKTTPSTYQSETVTKSQEPILIYDAIPIPQGEDINFNKPEHSFSQEGEELLIDPSQGPSFVTFLPHVQMLPDQFSTSPIYFEADVLTRMEGTNCFEFTNRMVEQFQTDWYQLGAITRAYLTMDDRLMDIYPMGENQYDFWDPQEDLENYKWAMCNIYSRSTDFLMNEAHERVMVPMFDMMNHSFQSNVSHDMDSNRYISVFASADIPVGAEILLNYGNFPNEKLLLVYGFVEPSNPFDLVHLYAPLPTTDPLFSPKMKVLETKFGITEPNEPYVLRMNQAIPESLLCTLRLMGLQSSEQWTEASGTTNESFDGILSLENEYGALVALKHALHKMARRLALNLISDENLQAASSDCISETTNEVDHEKAHTSNVLKSFDNNINVENCKVLCRSEYAILQCALQEVEHRLEILQNEAESEGYSYD
jgi:SET domain/Rubisco LSMT substrate-binding